MKDIASSMRHAKQRRATRANRSTYATLPGALLVGVPAAILGAVFWAACSVFTNMQLEGLVALVVGALVGWGVRSGGRGSTFDFGLMGAVLTLASCGLGQMLGEVCVNAKTNGVSYVAELRTSSLVAVFNQAWQHFTPMSAFACAAGACVGCWLAMD